MPNRGRLIILTGINGVGKDAQAKLLLEKAKVLGQPLELVHPLHTLPSVGEAWEALAARQHKLESHYAQALEILFMHVESAEKGIIPMLESGKNVLMNRGPESSYVYNILLPGLVQTRPELVKIYDQLMRELSPDLVLLLDAPVDVAMQRAGVQSSTDRFQGDGPAIYQERRDAFLSQAGLEGWKVVDASRSIEQVQEQAWAAVKEALTAEKPANKRGENPYVRKEGERLTVTPAGQRELERVVTDPTGQVYVFTKEVSPVMVAAAMARLSRRSGDMRLTYLDEFAGSSDADADALIERVVTQYGDDSVQQLIGLQLVVEEASNLLTKLLEWGRFAAYLEQSTRYIYFDQKKDGRYLYFTPPGLKPEAAAHYDAEMDALFDTYSSMVRRLTDYLREKHPEPADKKERMAWINSTRATACDAVRQVLPVATKSTVGIFGSSQAVESLIIHLLSEPLEEAQEVGQKILAEARKVIPSFLRRADLPERGGATSAYRATNREKLRDLAWTYLKADRPEASGEIELLDYWPKEEMDLVPEMLFEGSGLSLAEIKRQVGEWDEETRQEVFDAYMGTRLNRRHRPGRAIEKAHFELEIDGKDYGTFRDLQRHRVVDAWEWQRLNPYYGYDIPDLIREADMEVDFASCFERSATLYEYLMDEGYELEAQYATLLGHKMRYRFVMNLRALFHFLELRTGPDGHPGYRKICAKIYELIKEVYPRSAEAMRFINQREDPELTRMAAELATQFKLERLADKGEV